MHGGMATYHGTPDGARNCVEADRSRANDYYLTKATGVAQRFTADGNGYEAWAARLACQIADHLGRARPSLTRFPTSPCSTPPARVRLDEFIPRAGQISADILQG